MAPLFNTTLVCNTTLACASALDKVQERYEDYERLSYILGALLGIMFLLFICSPLIFNLPRDKDDDHGTSRAPPPPPPPQDDRIEMQDFAGPREMPSPEQFVIDNEAPNSTQSTLPDPRHFREVEVDGERFHINKSDATLLAETGVFRGAGDEMDLATRCVDHARSPSISGESEDQVTLCEDKIGTAV